MSYFNFEKLQIWNDARSLVKEVYRMTSTFPKDEIFGLTNQLRRATVSILLNLAEGANRSSKKEKIRFYEISHTSIDEVVAGFYVAFDLGYVKKLEFEKTYDLLSKQAAKTVALKNSIKSR
jgi:four helix bundle protein